MSANCDKLKQWENLNNVERLQALKDMIDNHLKAEGYNPVDHVGVANLNPDDNDRSNIPVLYEDGSSDNVNASGLADGEAGAMRSGNTIILDEERLSSNDVGYFGGEYSDFNGGANYFDAAATAFHEAEHIKDTQDGVPASTKTQEYENQIDEKAANNARKQIKKCKKKDKRESPPPDTNSLPGNFDDPETGGGSD